LQGFRGEAVVNYCEPLVTQQMGESASPLGEKIKKNALKLWWQFVTEQI